MTVTNQFIIRLAKFAAKDQKQVMEDNPDANYALMIIKCDQLSAEKDSNKEYELAEQIDNLKFMAGVFLVKQKRGAEAAAVEI